ncbi:hypothetical protein FNZ56_09125 [Pseudoluteimonas lycopersici]|uniref:TraB/GumN family protein n=2 Tax=Pseudoluteimonas lycopersici TaxID=1324796 RepID=A0A516V8G2_9GAMM|nr:DUF5694 domain-containing protein [Lysobacter lycopersici]QDQ74817.1 hypothetical protein FNZ56_09125 [Lysobacter lycopersici]
MKKCVAAFALCLSLSPAGFAQERVDLSTLDAAMPGPRTQVLVLGTVHLSQGGPEKFDPAALQPVLQRLAAYKPDIITIEGLSGETCEVMRHRVAYKQAIEDYCPDVAPAQAALGIDTWAALDQVDATLKAWPSQPAPSQRRHLAALFLAAGDPSSAMVQWLQLPDAERHAGDGLDDALAQGLRKRESGRNENVQIAARLAARLGLQRVFPVDDHTGDNLDIDDEDAFGKAITEAWHGASAEALKSREHVDALHKSGDMLATYRAVNSPEVLRLAIASDFGQALAEPSPQRYGRQYVGGWETRNLRMAANVHATFREHPGARVLSVVGSSHKPWFDGLLEQMQGVDIVDAEQVLE